MKASRAIRHFRTRSALARAMGVSRQTVWAWERKGELPELQALKCQQLIDAWHEFRALKKAQNRPLRTA